MNNKIGIRLEDKNKWETRTPIIPEDVKMLIEKESLDFIIQSSAIRSYADSEYIEAGARISSDLSEANVIFAIKEIPIPLLESNKTYIFFSHTIKGQSHNMPMLKRIIDLKATLIDYEKVVNEKGFRLIFFGNFAGLAGMNQALWAYGQRVKLNLGINTPFLKLKHTYQYNGIAGLETAVSEVGKEILEKGLPKELIPMIVGFAGYGNVSKGAQLVLDFLPVKELDPTELSDFFQNNKDDFSPNHVYKVVFKEEHMVKPFEGDFELQDYYKYGSEKYYGIFEDYLQYLSILINGIYWSEKYPRLLSKQYAKDMFQSKRADKLQVIGDISCDIEGGIEPNLMTTVPDNPVFIYNPFTEQAKIGLEGEGLAIMAVDNLPCELPKEASSNFSKTLVPFIPSIAKADYSKSFADLNLPKVIKDAVITHRGKLTPNYRYLEEYLEKY